MFPTPRQLERPPHVPEDNWTAVRNEERRLHEAIISDDSPAIIGALKSLVESVARVVKDIAGDPADSDAPFEGTVSSAHNWLHRQPGLDLATDPPFGTMASQAKKMAANLGAVRNEFGTGHGRARPPAVMDEMVELSMEGALIWVRWALRRLGPFTSGRPGPLIEDLKYNNFRAGLLAQRLRDANLPNLEEHHQRALGVAVGQRAARGTFVVERDGLNPAIESNELIPWTREYRWGLATGLLENAEGRWTLRKPNIQGAVDAIAPVPDNSPWLATTVYRLVTSLAPGPVGLTDEEGIEIHALVIGLASSRPAPEAHYWQTLAGHIAPPMP